MESFRSMLLNVGAKDNSFSTYRRERLEDEQQAIGMETKVDGAEQEDPAEYGNSVGLVLRRSLNQKRCLLYLVLGALFLLVIAFIIGYASSRRSCKACEEVGLDSTSTMVSSECDYQRDINTVTDPDPVLHWGDLLAMLTKYINQRNIIDHIRMMSEEPHPSGSSRLHELTTTIHNKFKSFNLHHVWADSHYVSLPFPDSSSPNYLWVTNENGTILEKVHLDNNAYFAYSPNGVVSGGLVYGYYGRNEDFETLKKHNVAVQGNIVILRVGRISFAEKVASAEQYGATGVLIYLDPSDYRQGFRDQDFYSSNCLSGHVHLGTGDPFTPGFPSFNHTQFPPINSSALPGIVAQPINAYAAIRLMSKLQGPAAPPLWEGSLPGISYRLGPDLENPGDQLQVSITSRMVPTRINNVFGSIDGFSEPDRYIIFGAQRDSWGNGAAKSGVGTAILLELAQTFSQMVANGFRPRRSLLFASWDAGEFGSVGATEWLEGYLTMMHLKAAAYFSLDKAVLGTGRLHTESSPLLHNLMKTTIKQISDSLQDNWRYYKQIVSRPLELTEILQPLTMDSSAYPFTAFAGVPAMELSFRQEDNLVNPFLNTAQDTYENLRIKTKNRLQDICEGVVRIVGQIALELTFNDRLHLNYAIYSEVTLDYINQFRTFMPELKSRGLTLRWLYSARGDFLRAAERLNNLISTSAVDNEALNRMYNDKIMRVEFYFLSQYVSATDAPFRHILHGRGDHTLEALYKHFQLLKDQPSKFDEKKFRKQLALVTWTLQGAANALSGDVWNIGNNSF